MVRIKLGRVIMSHARFSERIHFQELQRRLDQTLGKPGNYHHGIDKEGHIKPMTIGARLYRLENQVNLKKKNIFFFSFCINVIFLDESCGQEIG